MRLLGYLLMALHILYHGGGGAGQSDNKTELHVAFITSFEGEYDSSIAVPAVRLAAQRVNEDSSILSDHRIVVELVDDRTVARNFANSKVFRK